MNRTKLFSLGLIGAGLVLLGIAAFFLLPRMNLTAGKESTVLPVAVNYEAPQLALNDLQGKPASLGDYLGKVVLVNNWATWCPPCQLEMPDLEAYYEKHQAENFTIVAVEAGEPPNEVADFVKNYGLTFPVWLDPHDAAYAAFHYPGLPTSYVIDQQGKVRLVWMGAISRDALEKYITPLLED
jgi:peroxiredoxin